MKKNKFIFLDLDGVLNYENFYINFKPFDDKKCSEVEAWVNRYFCPLAVSNLNYITDNTGAKIVFSSSHRVKFYTLEECKLALKTVGITGEVVGMTPKLFFANKDYTYSVPRGCEIKAWMERNKGILGDKITKVKYAILDDDTDMLF